MRTKARIIMSDGRVLHKMVDYNDYFIKAEIEGMVRILKPCYFFKEKDEVLLEVREYTLGNCKIPPKWNT